MKADKQTDIAKQTRLSAHAESRLIVHVVQHLAPGGIESLVLSMLNHANDDEQVLVISLEGERQASLKAWSKLADFQTQLLFLNKSQGVSTSLIKQLSQLFRVLKPSAVHTHHIGPLLYAGCAARLAGIKQLVHTEHDGWHLDNPKHLRLQKVALALLKPRVIADADAVKLQLNQKVHYNDITVVKNGIDCQRFKPASQVLARQKIKLPIHGLIIGSAGRLEQVKGHDVLIRALPYLNDKISLAIAGQGSQAQPLKTLAQQLGVEHRIHWLGLVDDMPRFYQALDLFCLPSRHEGYPLSTLEAQSCGIATVATDVGATKETLCQSTGKLCPPENPQALAQHIIAALATASDVSPRHFVLQNNDLKQMVNAYRQIAMEGK